MSSFSNGRIHGAFKSNKKIQHFTQNYTFADLEERLVYLNTVRTFLYVWYVLVSRVLLDVVRNEYLARGTFWPFLVQIQISDLSVGRWVPIANSIGYLGALVSKLKEGSAGSNLLLTKEKCNRESKAECCQMSEMWGIGQE